MSSNLLMKPKVRSKGDGDLSDYEKIREDNIREKNALLESLNMTTAVRECKEDVGIKKKKSNIKKKKPKVKPAVIKRENLRSMKKKATKKGIKKQVESLEELNCDHCDFQSYDIAELTTHKKLSHPNGGHSLYNTNKVPREKRFECGDCSLRYKALHYLRVHVWNKDHKMKIDYEAVALAEAEKMGPEYVKKYKSGLDISLKCVNLLKDRKHGRKKFKSKSKLSSQKKHSKFECGDCSFRSSFLSEIRIHAYETSHKMKIDYDALALSRAKNQRMKYKSKIMESKLIPLSIPKVEVKLCKFYVEPEIVIWR